MKSVFHFIARHPWLYVVLAFILLIASWVVLILVAARHPNPEFKTTLPTHLDRYGALASAGASGRLKPALHCTAQVTLFSTLQRSAGSGAGKENRKVKFMAFTIRISRELDRSLSSFSCNRSTEFTPKSTSIRKIRG